VDTTGFQPSCQLALLPVFFYSWAIAQPGMFLTYKAALAGVPVIFVDPRSSPRECSQCGHTDKANRPSQSVSRAGSVSSLPTPTSTLPQGTLWQGRR
jgi:Putative transposase DNA-binding domain